MWWRVTLGRLGCVPQPTPRMCPLAVPRASDPTRSHPTRLGPGSAMFPLFGKTGFPECTVKFLAGPRMYRQIFGGPPECTVRFLAGPRKGPSKIRRSVRHEHWLLKQHRQKNGGHRQKFGGHRQKFGGHRQKFDGPVKFPARTVKFLAAPGFPPSKIRRGTVKVLKPPKP